MMLTTIIYTLIYIGLLLLPFSTDKDSSLGVISFGAPFLFIAAFLILISLIAKEKVPIVPGLKSTILISFLYATFILVSALMAPAVIPAMARALVNIVGFSIFVFVISIASDRIVLAEWKKKITASLITSGTILSIYFIVHLIYASYNNGFTEVMMSRMPDGLMSLPWGTSNTISAILIFPLIVTLVNMHSEKHYSYLNIIALSVIVLSIVATLSRAGIFLITYILLTISIVNKSLKWIIIFLIFIVSTIYLLKDYSYSGFEAISEARVEQTESGRSDVWQEYLQYIRENPCKPIGYYGSLYRFDYSGHNLILTTLVEMGFIGLFLTLALFINFFLNLSKGIKSNYGIQKKTSIIYLIGLSAVFINVQFEDPQYTQQYIIYFWIFMGLLCLSSAPLSLNTSNS